MILLVSDDRKGSGGIKKNCSSLNPEKFVKQEGLGWFSPHSSYSSAQKNHSSITNLLELLLRILPVILHLFLVWSRSRFWTPNKLALMLFFVGCTCTGNQFRKWMEFFFFFNAKNNTRCEFTQGKIWTCYVVSYFLFGDWVSDDWDEAFKSSLEKDSGLFLNVNVRLCGQHPLHKGPPDQLILSQTVSSQGTNVRDAF